MLIETHTLKKNLLDDYLNTYDRLFSRLRYFTLPFMGYAWILLFITFFTPQVLSIFIWVGIGLSILFGVGASLIALSLINEQRAIHDYYKTPYYERPLEIDETGIVLINEELPKEWMHQFIYEADMNTKQLETTRIIETEGLRAELNDIQSFSPPKMEDDDEMERKSNRPENEKNKIYFRPSMAKKYQKFMED